MFLGMHQLSVVRFLLLVSVPFLFFEIHMYNSVYFSALLFPCFFILSFPAPPLYLLRAHPLRVLWIIWRTLNQARPVGLCVHCSAAGKNPLWQLMENAQRRDKVNMAEGVVCEAFSFLFVVCEYNLCTLDPPPPLSQMRWHPCHDSSTKLWTTLLCP